jgi:hypothetical protein
LLALAVQLSLKHRKALETVNAFLLKLLNESFPVSIQNFTVSKSLIQLILEVSDLMFQETNFGVVLVLQI